MHILSQTHLLKGNFKCFSLFMFTLVIIIPCILHYLSQKKAKKKKERQRRRDKWGKGEREIGLRGERKRQKKKEKTQGDFLS